MKRKILASMLTIATVASLAGCQFGLPNGVGKNEPGPEPVLQIQPDIQVEVKPEIEPEIEPEVEPEIHLTFEQPDHISDDILDYQISIDGIIYTLPMKLSDVLSAGWDLKDADKLDYELDPKCKTTSTLMNDKGKIQIAIVNFDESGCALRDAYVTNMDIYRLGDFDIIIPGGIDLNNDTYDLLLEKMGEPDKTSELDNNIFFSYGTEIFVNDYYIMADMDTKKFCSVHITHTEMPEDFESADIDIEAVPDIVNTYVAPTEMSNDPADFIADIEGDLYQFPCPVSEFIKNGWTLVEEESSEGPVAGYSYGKVTLKRDNAVLETFPWNYCSHKTIKENCFITGFSLTASQDYKVTIVGGVNNKDTKMEDAWEILEPLGFEKNPSGNSTEYLLKYDNNHYYSVSYNNSGRINWVCFENDYTGKEYNELLGLR